MYALENGRICDSQFWHTLTENVRIRSSGEAARIVRQLQSDLKIEGGLEIPGFNTCCN